ncbi:MAG: M28 family peptidase [Cyclobacteriaceae bacterium]
MKRLFLIIAVLGFTAGVQAQEDKTASEYAATITEEDLTDDLTILASDALEGRETGERGQKMAAAYIREHFRSIGLDAPVPAPGGLQYYQPVKLYSSVPGETYLTVNGNTYDNFEDVIHFGSASTKEMTGVEVVFAGDGSEDAIKDLDLSGKAAMIKAEGMRTWRDAASRIEEKGAKLLLINAADDDEAFASMANQFRGYLSGGRLTLSKPEPSSDEQNNDVFFVSPEVTAEILNVKVDELPAVFSGETKKLKPTQIGYKISSETRMVESENVLGYLEGTDKKDELIILTAHYDHVGINDGKIYNGADDDGSGTSAILEIAEAFAKAKADGHGPKRSLLFMLVTGEEKGLLGSAYYASNPIYPLANTVANLNIDMIGRIDPGHKDNPEYVYLVGSDKLSSELHEISEKANSTYTNFDLDYTYNDPDHPDRIYYRSDHWNFAKNNIPVIFYFNGVHEDYHQHTDTVDKINFDILTKRAKLVFYTAWELANRTERIKVDVVEEESN